MTASFRKRSPQYPFRDKLSIWLRSRSLLPTRRLILLAAAGTVPALLAGVLPAAAYIFWLYNALLLLCCLIDWKLLPAYSNLAVQRELPERAEVLEPLEVRLRVTTMQPEKLQVELTDDLPASFEGALEERAAAAGLSRFTIGPGMGGSPEDAVPGRIMRGVLHGHEAEFSYRTLARQRGSYAFRYVYLRCWGNLGLVKKQLRCSLPAEIRIYPDLSGVRGVLGSMQNKLVLEGSRVRRREWSGNDFDHVREYAQGDEPRRMNWQAAARTAKLMTNVHQPERGKTVTLLIDCGRMMGVELDGRVKLDRTLEAALTTAAVALRQGDQVALLAFSSGIKVYVPPGKGTSHLHAITEAVYDLQPDRSESRYSAALSYLLKVLRRRSLILLFSDMESYLHDEELTPYVDRLRRSSAVLLLSLSDPLLHTWSRIRPEDTRSAYIQSTAHKFILERSAYVQRLARMGVPVLDVPVGRLALSAVNHYLELKDRGTL